MSFFNRQEKSPLITGIRPTGIPHIGNYVGALKPLIERQMQGEYACTAFIADLHAATDITARTSIKEDSIEVARFLLACGFDPQNGSVYRQSDVGKITAISNSLSNITSVGKLQTCTTFKDKSSNLKKGKILSAGLLNYPVLMCSDILMNADERLSDTIVVPVGEDQIQHLELASGIVKRVNTMFDLDFPKIELPAGHNPVRLPSLNGTGKMGKSEGNTITLIDSDEDIRAKIMAAVTDGAGPNDTMSESLENLFYFGQQFLSEKIHAEHLMNYSKGERKYHDIKVSIANAVIDTISPIRERYYTNKDCSTEAATDLLNANAGVANVMADRCYDKLRNAMNF